MGLVMLVGRARRFVGEEQPVLTTTSAGESQLVLARLRRAPSRARPGA